MARPMAAEVVEGSQDIKGQSRYCRGTTAIRHRERRTGVGVARALRYQAALCWAKGGDEVEIRFVGNEEGLGRKRRRVWVGMVEVDTGVWRGWEQEQSGVEQRRSVRSSPYCTQHTAPGAMRTWPIHPNPSSNPLILEMSRSAGCEATGQWAPIRRMAGFDASRGTGDRKSKRMAQYHTTATMPHGLAALVPGYMPCGHVHVPGGRAHLPSIVGPWGPLCLSGTGRGHPCQSRSLALCFGGNLYLIPSGRDVIIGRCSSWWGAGMRGLGT